MCCKENLIFLIQLVHEDEHVCRAFPANTLIASSDCIRSRSAAELLRRKRPSFLASRRFAKGIPETAAKYIWVLQN